jgi:hypothetical protein
VVLTWSPPAGDGGATITDYTVVRRTGSDSDIISIKVPATSCTWIDESVEKGKTYDYWVLAENSAGLSDKSELASITIPGDTSSSGPSVIIVTIMTIALACYGEGCRGARPDSQNACLPRRSNLDSRGFSLLEHQRRLHS